MAFADFDLLDSLQGKLRKYPHVRYEASPYHMTILPFDATGFKIEVVLQPRWYSVYCEGWYGAFEDSTDARDFVELALTETMRLEVWIRGRTTYRWILQRRDKKGWVEVGHHRGAFFRPFWRRRRIAYLQNRVLEAA